MKIEAGLSFQSRLVSEAWPLAGTVRVHFLSWAHSLLCRRLQVQDTEVFIAEYALLVTKTHRYHAKGRDITGSPGVVPRSVALRSIRIGRVAEVFSKSG
eukprot:16446282-Heterocapsa_arctica.AAC.1